MYTVSSYKKNNRNIPQIGDNCLSQYNLKTKKTSKAVFNYHASRWNITPHKSKC